MIDFIIFFGNANTGKDDREHRKFNNIDQCWTYAKRTYGTYLHYVQGRKEHDELQVTIRKNKEAENG